MLSFSPFSPFPAAAVGRTNSMVSQSTVYADLLGKDGRVIDATTPTDMVCASGTDSTTYARTKTLERMLYDLGPLAESCETESVVDLLEHPGELGGRRCPLWS